MKKNKMLSFTNIIVLLAAIVYILNLFAFSPNTGSTALRIIDAVKEQGLEITKFEIIIFQIIGIWGGNLNDILGFNITNILSGEVWRIYTVVITHAHLPHFVMNMAALIIAGNHIEKKYGTKKTIILFLILTALNGFITDLIYFKLLNNEIVTSYGASGWITSLMGMILAKCLIDKKYYKKELGQGERVYLIIYFVSTTFILIPNAFTITAHISGLLVGALVEYLIYIYTKQKKTTK